MQQHIPASECPKQFLLFVTGRPREHCSREADERAQATDDEAATGRRQGQHCPNTNQRAPCLKLK
eukprot:2467759-Pyramimonas_sp.AAC.1